MITRRDFLKTVGAAAVVMAIDNPAKAIESAASNKRIFGANGKVDVALIGIGNRGEENAMEVSKTGLANVVAICDVNMGAAHTQKVMSMFPSARRYKDFRKMFDEMGSHIEAVFVSTPDFSHFPICMHAIKSDISVYCEKPMTRTFHETQLLMDAAARHPKVVTQMGNQGHSGENYFQFKAWMDAGIISDVTAITAHMNNSRRWHVLDPNITKFPDADPMPETMNWDVWQMQTLHHDYSKWFDGGNWRCWYDFGMGALGDWGAHILDTAHQFLQLGLPSEVGMTHSEGHNDYFFPMSSTIRFHFPRRSSMPACDVTWYDGINNRPELPAGYGQSEAADVPTVAGQTYKAQTLNPGKIIYGRDFIFKGASHSSPLHIIPESLEKQMIAEHRLPEVPASPSNHWANFLNACLGKEKTRSPFEVAGELCQVMNLGVIAQRLDTTFKFDRFTGEIVDNPFANALLAGTPPRMGWEEYYKL